MIKSTASRLLAAMLFCGLTLPALAAGNSDYTKTKYPIVLVHGLFGFDKLLGFYDYFLGVPQALESGGATVYVTQTSAVNDSIIRGEQLILQLDNIRALHPEHTKFNLIAHSQGGLESRYVASVRPDLIASVTTVATPHLGAPAADALVGLKEILDQAGWLGEGLEGIILQVVEAFGSIINALGGDFTAQQDTLGALTALNSADLAIFNAAYPDGAPTTRCGSGPELVNGIRYYSYGGTGQFTNVLDGTSYGMATMGTLLPGPTSEGNDGAVPRCSSHWGTVVRDNYNWNHVDEVNQIAGLLDPFAANPLTVYRSHANRLKQQSL